MVEQPAAEISAQLFSTEFVCLRANQRHHHRGLEPSEMKLVLGCLVPRTLTYPQQDLSLDKWVRKCCIRPYIATRRMLSGIHQTISWSLSWLTSHTSMSKTSKSKSGDGPFPFLDSCQGLGEYVCVSGA